MVSSTLNNSDYCLILKSQWKIFVWLESLTDKRTVLAFVIVALDGLERWRTQTERMDELDMFWRMLWEDVLEGESETEGGGAEEVRDSGVVEGTQAGLVEG